MSKRSTCTGNAHTQEQMNHHSNQRNPNNSAYKASMDNHSNQCNPNNSKSNGLRLIKLKY